MADQFDSPVDVAASDVGVPGLTHMGMAVGAALFTVLMLNAHALAAWADALAPGARTAAIMAPAHILAERTAARGLDAPRSHFKAQWERAKAARWRGQGASQR